MSSFKQGREESNTLEFKIELAKLEEVKVGSPLFREKFPKVVETYLNFRDDKKDFGASLAAGIQVWAKRQTEKQGKKTLKIPYDNMIYFAVEGYIAALLGKEKDPNRANDIYNFINDRR